MISGLLKDGNIISDTKINMGKRSNFTRIPRDAYDTPLSAVIPLIPHLTDKNYHEPCAGKGELVKHLSSFGLYCDMASDIKPREEKIEQLDATRISYTRSPIITNPPWDRKILHPLIEHFSSIAPHCWLLFDADWAHTKQSISLMKRCEKIVSIGRVKWFPDSKMSGKDNVCWYKFNYDFKGNTTFHGRT